MSFPYTPSKMPDQWSAAWLDNEFAALKRGLELFSSQVVRTEVGSWTPVPTFSTPGDFAATWSTQRGSYTKTGNDVRVTCELVSSAFTHTTAAGVLEIGGLPFASSAVGGHVGDCEWQGITKAGYTDIVSKIVASNTKFRLVASGSGVSAANVTAADMPTGGSVRLITTFLYTI